jgi:hypothetical protein
MHSSREVRILKDLRGEIAGRDVLVVEDIVDTGFTLHHVKNLLLSREPKAAEVCALAGQAHAPRGADQGDLDRLRDPRRIRGGLWHRLCATEPQPALHRQGALHRGAMNQLRWLLRAKRWARIRRPGHRVKLVYGAIVVAALWSRDIERMSSAGPTG